MIGVVLVDRLDDGLLGVPVSLADEIIAPFLLDLELVDILGVAHERVAATARCHYSHIQ